MSEETIILPVVELEDNSIGQELMEILQKKESNSAIEKVEACIKDPASCPQTLSGPELILLQLLMNGIIGTSSQRGSITRIMNTLKEAYLPEENTLLKVSLDKAARSIF